MEITSGTSSTTRMESPWFRQFAAPSDDARLQLYCFPHAGGAASAYVPLSRALGREIEVHAVQYPGRQDRRLEAPVTSVVALAESVATELAARPEPHRPYAFFGHSMGAAVAYETARLLARRAVPAPLRLFLSGRGAPTPNPPRTDQLHDDEALVAAIRRLGGTGGRFLEDPELLEMILPALRADYRALSGYHWAPGPPLDIPFTVLVGDADPVVAVPDAADWLGHSALHGDFRTFPGGHFFLDSNTAEIVDVIRGALSGASA
ncbi:thioesterase II family protein [Streptomyces apocyni]|uniref:thioesterase II family protein n=1 Tax=Streptomyces apocyni TaxID=2654677 RepID=UPI001E3BE0CB|nr:alpha/beta fold hydrolase [Streptomyces apocyni]